MNHFFKFILVLILLLVFSSARAASNQTGDKDYLARVRTINEKIKARLHQPVKQLDIDLIMEGSNFFGSLPHHVRWDSDGSRLWFQWKRWNEEELGTFEYVLSTGKLRRLNKDEAERVPSYTAVWDKARRQAMWTVRDTVWLYDGEKKTSVPLVSGIGSTPPEPEYTEIGGASMIFYEKINPVRYVGSGAVEPVAFSPDGSKAVLFYDNNLFAVDLESGKTNGLIKKLTNIKKGKAPEQDPPTPGQKYIKQEQLKLFDVLKRRHDRQNKEKARAAQNQPAPFYLEGWTIYAMIPSADLAYCAVMLSRPADNARIANIPNFITVSGYTENIPTYAKAGDPLSQTKLGIIELDSGRMGWLDFGQKDREVGPSYVKWSPDNRRALVTFFSTDFKDAYLGMLEPFFKKGEHRSKIPVKILANDHDDAWVNLLAMVHFGWLPGGNGAWFVSERHGWMHLYSVSLKGGDVQPLTKGDYLVLCPRLTPDNKALIFCASVPNPFEIQTYILPLKKGKLRQVTAGMGRADGILSPDGNYLAAVASDANKPWELYVKRMDEPGMGTKVTDSSSPAFKSYPWIAPEIIHFKAEDGTPIPARLYFPESPHPKRPAMIFAHGAGWLHNVHRWWATYSHEYCFHHLLMERGYIVLDIDFRGSAGYGRDWRTAVYRDELAGKVSDVRDGSIFLTKKYRVDPERIGIYGGSGGGVMTLMALFTTPKYFGAGAALRSLPDIAHYAFPLPRCTLNTPQEDPIAYYRSSAIYHVEGLEDPLLICHGTSDVNTHLHGVMRLVQRLIELRKENWELAVYPMESHSFVEPCSWADEYRRILKLFEENLKK
ncbi:MAG: prolyl oligopeptidase family serine peptidase [Candidatus Aminicenantes bacterium]|jgi:dipeptidyl aminopeptidase/acylaminoacyl peptidase